MPRFHRVRKQMALHYRKGNSYRHLQGIHGIKRTKWYRDEPLRREVREKDILKEQMESLIM